MSKCGSSGSCLGSSLSRLTMSLSTLSYCPLTATESPWILVVMRLGTGRIGGSIFVGGSLVFHSHTSSVTFYKLSAPTIIMVQTCNRCGNFRRSWFLLWNSHVDWGRWQLVTCQSCCAAQLSYPNVTLAPLPVGACCLQTAGRTKIRNDPEQWSQIRSTWTLKLNISAVTNWAVVVITMNKHQELYFLSMW